MGLSTREEDFVEHLLLTSSHNMLLFITNQGRVYSLKGYEIPDSGRTGRGMAIVNLLQLNPEEKVATVIPISGFEDGKYLVMGTKSGIVKKTKLKEYCNLRKGGLIAIELREDDELVNARLVDDDEDLMIVTRKGMSIRFSESDVRATGRASIGVRGIALRPGDEVIGMDVCSEDASLLIITEKGFGKRTEIDEYKVQSRGGKGVMTYRITEKTGELAGMMMVNDDHDVMLITSEGVIIRLHAADISVIGRATKGVTLMRTKDGTVIVGCARTDREEEENTLVPEETPVEGEEDLDFETEDGSEDLSEEEGDGPNADGRDVLNKLGLE